MMSNLLKDGFFINEVRHNTYYAIRFCRNVTFVRDPFFVPIHSRSSPHCHDACCGRALIPTIGRHGFSFSLQYGLMRGGCRWLQGGRGLAICSDTPTPAFMLP